MKTSFLLFVLYKSINGDNLFVIFVLIQKGIKAGNIKYKASYIKRFDG